MSVSRFQEMNPVVVLATALATMVVACAPDLPQGPSMDLGPGVTFTEDSGTDDAGPGCFDRVRDTDETDVDCGGPACAPCAAGKACDADHDCLSGICLAFACAESASCSNQRKDGSETDVDCGGADCGKCPLGRACRKGDDCDTTVCRRGVCSPLLVLSFAKPVVSAAVPTDCWGIAAGDLDGDKRLDVVVGSYVDSRVQALYGRGDGTFLAGTPTDRSSNITMLATGDFDSDGRDDVVVRHSNAVSLFLSAPQRTLMAPTVVVESGAEVIAVGDWDGDKRKDLVVGEHENFSLLRGDGLGGFQAPLTGTLGGSLSSVQRQGIAVGDLNGDGGPDLVISYQSTVVAVTGMPHKGFWNVLYTAGPLQTSYGPGGIGDFDNDGVADIVALTGLPSFDVSRGDGKGGFQGVVQTRTATAAAFVGTVLQVADFDRDGYDDAVTLMDDGHMLIVWRGVKTGQLARIIHALPVPVETPRQGVELRVVVG